jgi:general secretion pathway protein G
MKLSGERHFGGQWAYHGADLALVLVGSSDRESSDNPSADQPGADSYSSLQNTPPSCPLHDWPPPPGRMASNFRPVSERQTNHDTTVGTARSVRPSMSGFPRTSAFFSAQRPAMIVGCVTKCGQTALPNLRSPAYSGVRGDAAHAVSPHRRRPQSIKERTVLQRLRAARQKESGFTLIELLIVIVILGILAGIVVFAVNAFQNRGKDAACQADYKTAETAIEAYYAQNSTYPPDLPTLVTKGYLKDALPDGTGNDSVKVTYATTSTGYTMTATVVGGNQCGSTTS